MIIDVSGERSNAINGWGDIKMSSFKISMICCALAISACSSGGSGTDDPVGQGGGTPIFNDTLGVTTEELASFSAIEQSQLFQFQTFNVAPEAEMSELIASQISGT
ncbi:MAG: hypothetical protein AAFY03_10945, partial [Pseudomonadota bacterium]